MKPGIFLLPMHALGRDPVFTLREDCGSVMLATLTHAMRTITLARGSRRAAGIPKE